MVLREPLFPSFSSPVTTGVPTVTLRVRPLVGVLFVAAQTVTLQPPTSFHFSFEAFHF